MIETRHHQGIGHGYVRIGGGEGLGEYERIVLTQRHS